MIPQRLEDFPPDARWIQTQRGVVIVCNDGTVYRRTDGRTIELTGVTGSLLREPTTTAPPGCYCKPGRCAAPPPHPCRDPEKAAQPKE